MLGNCAVYYYGVSYFGFSADMPFRISYNAYAGGIYKYLIDGALFNDLYIARNNLNPCLIRRFFYRPGYFV